MGGIVSVESDAQVRVYITDHGVHGVDGAVIVTDSNNGIINSRDPRKLFLRKRYDISPGFNLSEQDFSAVIGPGSDVYSALFRDGVFAQVIPDACMHYACVLDVLSRSLREYISTSKEYSKLDDNYRALVARIRQETEDAIQLENARQEARIAALPRPSLEQMLKVRRR
jgi:hypothetical protein